MLWSILAVSVLLAGDAPASQEKKARLHLDPAFSTWVQAKNTELPYRALARRFVLAGGRDVAAYDRGMAALESRFRTFLESSARTAAGENVALTPKQRAEQLQQFFFQRERFEANLDLTQVQNLFPDSILSRRQGYCLGLSVLLLDLCERVQLPLSLISAPRHTFVRIPGPPPVNLETTRGGEMHSDAWYTRRFALGAADTLHLLRGLTAREAAAHLVNNHGFALLEEGHLDAAKRDFEAALKLSATLVEASINLGVLLARQEKYADALPHFVRARRAWPHDPYVRMNQINTLTNLGRTREAAALLTALYRSHPQLSGVDKAVHELRSALHPVEDWDALQALVLAVNERRAEGGKAPGLAGTYYRDMQLRDAVRRRIDRDISFQWNWNAPAPGVPRDRFSIRWRGWLQVPAADEYTFFVTCSDGVRIWIDGRQVLDAWTRTRENFSQGSVQLLPGLHDLRIEYFESNGEAGIAMFLTAKKRKKHVSLPPLLFHPTQ
ncbi:MAG: PA14 domain-containing protein [Planctomycetota bacterium]